MIEEINAYYKYRGLKDPDALEAIMWLVSEVGELVDAYCETVLRPYAFPPDGVDFDRVDDMAAFGKLQWLISACKNVEAHVSRLPGWTRNNQPKGTYDIPGEIGDVLMMLEKFAEKMELPESDECLRAKMKRKMEDK